MGEEERESEKGTERKSGQGEGVEKRGQKREIESVCVCKRERW